MKLYQIVIKANGEEIGFSLEILAENAETARMAAKRALSKGAGIFQIDDTILTSPDKVGTDLG